MSTEIESKTNVNDCAPRNALFCCRSPVCFNNSPKLVPPVEMDQSKAESGMRSVYPVTVPDLSDPQFYTNLMSQPSRADGAGAAAEASASDDPSAVAPLNKSQSVQDIRHGVALRRVTPPKSTVTVKRSDAPLMNVVLRKVEKKLLEPPKPIKHERSPPPKKISSTTTGLATSASTSALVEPSPNSKKKKSRAVACDKSAAIAKSKSTNDVIGKQKEKAGAAAATAVAKPPPPVNLLKVHRPLEVHRIEGDKIIIIRRVPRSRRAPGDPKAPHSMPTSPIGSSQVTKRQSVDVIIHGCSVFTFSFTMLSSVASSLLILSSFPCCSHSRHPPCLIPLSLVFGSFCLRLISPSTRSSARLSFARVLQNRISTYDFPVFCENEKSLYPTTVPAQSTLESSQSTDSDDNETDTEAPLLPMPERPTNRSAASLVLPLAKSTSARSLAQQRPQQQPLQQPPSQLQQQQKPLNLTQQSPEVLKYRSFAPAQSNEVRAAGLLQPAAPKPERKLSVSKMYDEDIDFMNKYLKSLPDYRELNKEISTEHKKCEDMYDKLQSINSSLKSSNFLPKSNSFHGIAAAPTKPLAMPAIAAVKPQNKLSRSPSNSLINRNAMPSVIPSARATPTAPTPFAQCEGLPTFGGRPAPEVKASDVERSMAALNAAVSKQSQQPHPVQSAALPKSASSSCVNHMLGSKRCLNDFWTEHLARNNQQKFGWNYGRIMAAKNGDESEEGPPQPESGDCKLQRNMSLNQIDRKIRQNVSREELYNMICNNEPPSSRNPLAGQQPRAQAGNALAKSVSHSNVPSSGPHSVFSAFAQLKAPRKASIPQLFKPLCKSTSSTHVFNTNFDKEEPKETFTPKLLVKSSSSSSVPMSGEKWSANYFRPIQSQQMEKPIAESAEIARKAEPPKPRQSNFFQAEPAKPQPQQFAEEFFVKQNVPPPNKVIVNYPPLKSSSSAHVPFHGSFPSAFGANDSTTGPGNQFYNSCATVKQRNHPNEVAGQPEVLLRQPQPQSQQQLLQQPKHSQPQPQQLQLPRRVQNSFQDVEIDVSGTRSRNMPAPLTRDSSNTNVLSSFRNHCPPLSTLPNAERREFAVSKQNIPNSAARAVPMQQQMPQQAMIKRPVPQQPMQPPGKPHPVAMTSITSAPIYKKIPHSLSSSCISDLLARAKMQSYHNAPDGHGNYHRNLKHTFDMNNGSAAAQEPDYLEGRPDRPDRHLRMFPRRMNPPEAQPAPKEQMFAATATVQSKPAAQPFFFSSSQLQHQPTHQRVAAPPKANGPYGLCTSKSTTAIASKDSAWLQKNGYEVIDYRNRRRETIEVAISVLIVARLTHPLITYFSFFAFSVLFRVQRAMNYGLYSCFRFFFLC